MNQDFVKYQYSNQDRNELERSFSSFLDLYIFNIRRNSSILIFSVALGFHFDIISSIVSRSSMSQAISITLVRSSTLIESYPFTFSICLRLLGSLIVKNLFIPTLIDIIYDYVNFKSFFSSVIGDSVIVSIGVVQLQVVINVLFS